MAGGIGMQPADERAAVPLVTGKALGERLFEAHAQRRFGSGPADGDERSQPVGADGAREPTHEMLQFVLALDERSLVRRGVFGGVAGGGALPRRIHVDPPLPRRRSGGGSSGTPTSAALVACPRCDTRRLRVDEIDLDAAIAVRTCVACEHTFTSTI